MTDDKQLQIEGLKKNLANTEKELEIIPGFIKTQEEKRALLVEMRAAETKMHEIALENFVPLKHDWEFQKNPEWLECQKTKSKIDFRMRGIEHEATLRTIDRNLESQKSQIISLEQSAENLRKQIAALEAAE